MVKETAVVHEVACQRRRCPVCGPVWKRYHLARLFSGTNGVDPGRLRLWTITAPSEVSDSDAWNRSVLERWKLVWRGFGRHVPASTAYYGVKEFQARGLFHLHTLIRLAEDVTLEREAFGPDGWIEDLLRREGFGYVNRLQRLKGKTEWAASYLSKYLLKSVWEDAFPKWSHLDFWSKAWPLEWSPRRVVSPSGVEVRSNGLWSAATKWEYAGQSVREVVERSQVIDWWAV